MRISTNLFRESGVDAILRQQSQLSELQNKIASGKRVVSPSDDPVASALILNFKQELDITERFQVNLDAAESRIGLQEEALTTTYSTLQRVRELLVQAGSGVYGSQEKAAIAAEVSQRLDEVLGLANSQFGGTEYIFAGSKTDTLPFSRDTASPSGFRYDGDQAARQVQISSSISVTVADSGYEVFQRIKNGNGTFRTSDSGNTITLTANTGSGVIDSGSIVDSAAVALNPTDSYSIQFSVNGLGQTVYDVVNTTTSVTVVSAAVYTSGDDIQFDGRKLRISGTPSDGDTFSVLPSTDQDIFSTLQQGINALTASSGTAAEQARQAIGVGRALTEIDQALEHLDVKLGAVGAQLNVTESERFANQDLLVLTKTTLSRLEDLDMVEALSSLQQRKLTLEVAQQSYVQVSNLSLFNFLR
ncbi:MAG: flagellar hook-associated protein FlgL [Gammaproteobacteria bacterium]|nr:flagellar hook-associated protein FlgL [Gammaproteobacteria bacterium]